MHLSRGAPLALGSRRCPWPEPPPHPTRGGVFSDGGLCDVSCQREEVVPKAQENTSTQSFGEGWARGHKQVYEALHTCTSGSAHAAHCGPCHPVWHVVQSALVQ